MTVLFDAVQHYAVTAMLKTAFPLTRMAPPAPLTPPILRFPVSLQEISQHMLVLT